MFSRTLRLGLLLVATSGLFGQDNIYFGNLHSHTAYSDGTGTPRQAYDHARTVAKLDFLAITEHNHSKAGSTGDDPLNLNMALNHALYNGPAASSLIATANQINLQFPNQFVALYGQEFSTNSGGNHINVFDVGEVISEELVPNKRFDVLYGSWLSTHLDSTNAPAIVQFNHPKSLEEDYGMLNYSSLEAVRVAAAPYVRTIQIINGPHSAKEPGHRVDNIKWRRYLEYLNAGFRLAPTADQDNHFLTHGSATDHRTAVLAAALTKAEILKAIRLRRVYATQDKNLKVWFTINGQPLGSVLTVAAGTPLQIKVRLSDADEPGARYRVSLRRDVVGSEVDAKDELAGSDRTGDGAVDFDQFQHTAEDEYFVVQIVQTGGDGADMIWTAPIWVTSAGDVVDEHPIDNEEPPAHTEEFVWSQNSEVYHLASCRVVKQIASTNKQSGHTPPAGKRLHSGCPQ
jgi:trimeric autotransporter adhesin